MNVDLTFRAQGRGPASTLTTRLMEGGLNVNRSPKADGSFAVYAIGQIEGEDYEAFVAEVTEGLGEAVEYVG